MRIDFGGFVRSTVCETFYYEPGTMNDREVFRQTRSAYRKQGENDVLSRGIVVDEVLVRELRQNGSDVRYGVNLICCPNQATIDYITALQRRLCHYEPAQYYYPVRDLHLTLVEICHSRMKEDADRLASIVQSMAPAFLEQQSPALLDEPMLVYDRQGAALNFLPCDEQLQHLRQALRNELARGGVMAASRYAPTSAHITLLRYITPLTTPVEQWVEILNDSEGIVKVGWRLTPVWLTWGATWYNRERRVSRYGPIRVGSYVSQRF